MFLRYSRFFLIVIFAVLFLIGCTAQSIPNITPTSSPTTVASNIVSESKATSVAVIKVTPTSTNLHCPPEQTAKIVYGGSYVGLQYPPSPTWLEFFDSLTIGGSYDGVQFGINHAFDGQSHYFLLTELLCLDNENHAHHKIVDEIKLPPLNENDYVFAAACHLIDVENHVVALGHFTDTPSKWSIVASRAWLVDYDNASFVELSTEQVESLECFDDCPRCHDAYK